MAFLVADKVTTVNGVKLNEKIIPLSAKRKNGNYFRDQRKLKPLYVTIHNTGEINQAKGTTMAEQYTRATYPNDNMGTVRPHFYVDSVEAWQLIELDRVAWHAGEQGNIQSIGIEIIGAGGEDNGARLAAWVLDTLGLTTAALRTHNYWMGQPDKIVAGARKNCPYYILPHWSTFVKKVASYQKGKPDPDKGDDVTDTLYRVQVGAFRVRSNAEDYADQIRKAGFDAYVTTAKAVAPDKPVPKPVIKKGDLVKVKRGAKTYTGGNLSSWVYGEIFTVLETPRGDRVVIGQRGQVTAAVHARDLIKQ